MLEKYYEYWESCREKTKFVPLASFNHDYTAEDMDLDSYVCETCFCRKREELYSHKYEEKDGTYREHVVIYDYKKEEFIVLEYSWIGSDLPKLERNLSVDGKKLLAYMYSNKCATNNRHHYYNHMLEFIADKVGMNLENDSAIRDLVQECAISIISENRFLAQDFFSKVVNNRNMGFHLY